MTSSRIFVRQSVLGHTDPPQVSSSLAITSIEAGDAGSYGCVARNPLLVSTATSSLAAVTVRGKKKEKLDGKRSLYQCINILFLSPALPSPPTINQQPNDVIVVPGQSATFTCLISGEPLPIITWTRNNITLIPSTQVISLLDYPSLFFT